MSETELHTGTIKLITRLRVEEEVKKICEKEGIELKGYSTYQEAFMDEYWRDEYIIADGGLWSLNNTKQEPYELAEMTCIGAEEYKYTMMFYNGGTCLSEMLEDSLKEERTSHE